MEVELESLLAIEFLKHFRINYRYNLYSMANVKKTKWWNHFVKFAKVCKLNSNNTGEFMKYSFLRYKDDYNKKLYPYFFSTKEGKIYLKEFFQEQEVNEAPEINYKEILIINTLKEVLKWCKLNKKGVTDFIKDSSNFMKIERGVFYLPFFYFSKTFNQKFEMKDELTVAVEKNDFRRTTPSIYYSMREIMKDDFME